MITKLEIDGYRLLKDFTADFRPLTVVIGANSTGKSTLLDCLQCISECAMLPINRALLSHWGLVSLLNAADLKRTLTWKITFTTQWPGLPPLMKDASLVYEVLLQADSAGQATAQYEVLRRHEPRPGYAEPFKFLELTPYKRNIHNPRSHRFEPFDEAVPQPDSVRESSDETTTNGKALPAHVQEPALMLSQMRFFNEFPIPSAARALLASMAFYPGFDVTRFSALRARPAEIRPHTTLLPNGENLGTVLHEILTRYNFRDAANDLREFLKTAYPSFEEINAETTFGTPPQVMVMMREKGMQRSLSLWELSDGMLRFLCLATALLNPLAPPFIAIDEPEAGFHPRLLPIVADMIKTASERTQVLVTTHSPDLLNRFDIEDVAVMARADEEPRAGWHRPADRATLVQMLRSVEGETLGDLHRSGELEAIR